MEANNMAMREALEYLCSISDLDLSELEMLGKRLEDTSTYGGGLVLKLVHGVRNGQKALAKPPRNCDKGTAEEQYWRHDKFCDAARNRMYGYHCDDAPKCVFCFAKWEQMPYAEGGAK